MIGSGNYTVMGSGSYTLITGGAGFIGCNLADALLSDGESVVIADNFSRDGVERNARWLADRHKGVRIEHVDVRDRAQITPLVTGASRVFHLAAQVAVTTSMEDPRLDFETNLLGTFNILEAARSASTPPALIFTSTNKVYGALDHLPVVREDDGYMFEDGRPGVDESTPLDFHSPYGCSKGAADQYIRDYGRVYGLPTVVFRMSCVYGTHQLGTEDQGWVAHFARAILGGTPITIFGDGHQVRDILWVDDVVRAFRAAADRAREIPGTIFNIGGGPSNAVSVREVIGRLMTISGRQVPVTQEAWRPGDQRVYVTDIGKARRELAWQPRMGVDGGLRKLHEWLEAARLDKRVDEAVDEPVDVPVDVPVDEPVAKIPKPRRDRAAGSRARLRSAV